MTISYNVVFSKGFYKELRKLSGVHQKAVMKKLLILREDPFYPSLRSKMLKGDSELYESSINMDIRIIWEIEDDETIMLVDVGHHDILKKY